MNVCASEIDMPTRPRKRTAANAAINSLIESAERTAELRHILKQIKRPLRTNEAADYLTHVRGCPTSPGHLANTRVIGGGPAFAKSGRYVTYTIAALDDYADRRIGPELRSTARLRRTALNDPGAFGPRRY
jgi:hypothetical protein